MHTPFSFLVARQSPGNPQSKRPRTRLILRCLEGRFAPALLTVTSPADAGAGSLRDILTTANTNGVADTITFDKYVSHNLQ